MAEARSWVGTPYQHQQSMKGVAVDCVGLILGVGKAAGVLDIDLAKWAAFAAYTRAPNPRRMRRGMETFLAPLCMELGDLPAQGSIAWFSWRQDLPMHLGILASYEGRDTVIHAFNHVGRCVEHQLDQTWRGRVHSWWRYPGVI